MAPPKRPGYIVDRRDAEGQTKLMTAVSRGLLKETFEIIAEGADINAQDHAGRSVVFHAVWSGEEALAALLLNKGAKADSTSKTGLTPLMVAAMQQRHEALEQLINHKAPLDKQTTKDGETALMLALKFKDAYAAFRLLKAGADADTLTDKEGFTAVQRAKQHLTSADSAQFIREVGEKRAKLAAAREKEIADNAQDATVLSHDIAPVKKITLKLKPAGGNNP
jgi:ankyrin repeat protein